MNLEDFCTMMQLAAPRELAMDGDNIGLLVGTTRNEIRKVAVALDCTAAVAEEAARLDCDLVLTHHPMFFHPVQYLRPDLPATAAAFVLARHNIAMFAAHTNLDAAAGGVNDCLAAELGLINVKPLPPENLGRLAQLPQGMSYEDFIRHCEARLHTRARFVGELGDTVESVAMIGGAGGGDVWDVYKSGADVYVTGEVKYGQALEAEQLGMKLVCLGHYETESVVLKPLIRRLQELSNDVQYNVIYAKQTPLGCLAN